MQEHLVKVQTKLNDYLSAPKGARKEPRKAYFAAMKEFNDKFNPDIQHLNIMQQQSPKKIWLTDAEQLALHTRGMREPRRSTYLVNSDAYRNLATVARYATHIGNGLAIFEFGSAVYKTYDTYKDGGDWDGEMLEGLSEFVGGAVGAELAIGIMTASGLWVIPMVVVASIGIAETFKLAARKIHEYDLTHQLS